jgi:hypothetical protein
VLSRAAARACGVDVDREDLGSFGGRKDGVDTAAGSHVQHPVAVLDLGEDRFAEQVGHRRDRHDLRHHHQSPTEIGERVVTISNVPRAAVGALMPLTDALGALLGHERSVARFAFVDWAIHAAHGGRLDGMGVRAGTSPHVNVGCRAGMGPGR